jgi:hypothetical protein
LLPNVSSTAILSPSSLPSSLFWPITSIFPQNGFHNWARRPVIIFSHPVIVPYLLNRYCIIKNGLLLWVL